jgi:hypothetical protein
MSSEISTPEMRRFACGGIDELTHDDANAVFRFLSIRVGSDKFSIHGGGCSINLDEIADNIIQDLYTLILKKLSDDE